jgi:hypothetical protein
MYMKMLDFYFLGKFFKIKLIFFLTTFQKLIRLYSTEKNKNTSTKEEFT